MAKKKELTKHRIERGSPTKEARRQRTRKQVPANRDASAGPSSRQAAVAAEVSAAVSSAAGRTSATDPRLSEETFTEISSLKMAAAQLEMRERQTALLETALLAELGRKALAAEPLEQLFQAAVERVAESLHVDFCEVLKLLPGGKKLLLLSGAGWEEGLVGCATVPTGTDSQAGYTLQSAGPIIVRDFRNEKRFRGPRRLIDHGVVCGISVVIGPPEAPWGVLGTHAACLVDFTIDDANFVRAIANVLWEAIERQRVEADVRDRERRLTLVTDAMPVLIAYCDRDMVYRFCNGRYEEWFGLKQTDINGKHLSEVLGEQAFQAIKPHVERVLNGERVTFEQLLPYRHGPARFVRVEYLPDRRDGKILGYYAMIQDISEIVKAEQLRARMSAIVEHSNDAIIGKDPQGVVTNWNAAASRMYGYTAKEMVGQPLFRITPPDRKYEVQEILQKIDRGQPVKHYETVRKRKDGTLLDVSLTVSPIFDHQGQLVGASSIARDITQRKRQEQRLKDLNETLEHRVEERASLIKLLHDVTAACHDASTLEQAVAYVLRAFSRYGGWCFGHALRPADERPLELIRFMECYEEVPGRFEQFRQATSQLRLARGQGLPGRVFATGTCELVVDHLGEQLPLRRQELLASGIQTAAAFPVRVGEEVVAVLEFFSDARHELDDRTLEAMESIGSQLGRVVERTRLQREVADLASQEQQRIGGELHDTVIQQLTGGEMMAESLRQKVAAGRGLKESDAANLVQILRDAQRQVRRLHRGLMPVEVDAAGLMSALESLAYQTTESHEVQCVYECGKDVLIPDNMMATHLYRIAQEAVHNAVKHAQPRHITVTLTSGDCFRLVVQDDGRGIQGNLPTLTGNGLRIMRYRAEVIDGRLTIESHKDRGTTVTCIVNRTS